VPFYKYMCPDCDYEGKISHKMREKIKYCPNCNSEDIKKVIGNFVSKMADSKIVKSKLNVETFIKNSKKDLDSSKQDFEKREL